jgi:2-polyprenyl-6-methoxyphenol hydroxylase-like FAD-dependent oxidoreductase
MWRGTCVTDPFLDGRTMVWAGHPRQKLVAYPIEDLPDGRQVVNVIAELKLDQARPDQEWDWSKPGRLDDVLPAFAGWVFDWLDCPALIGGTDALFVYPMVDRDPLDSWTSGSVTLLGDAAHPMYPIGSNGASQAILDARVLAGCVRSHPGDPLEALRTYEDVRRPATSRVVLANRELGPERPMAVVEERAPDGYERLSDVISDEELARLAEDYKQLAGFSVAELNERPSLVGTSW